VSGISLQPDELQRIPDLVDALGSLTKYYQIYGVQHPRCQEALAKFREDALCLSQLPGIGTELVLAWHDRRLYLEHVPLPALRRTEGSQLLAHLERLEMVGFRLKLDIGPEEIIEVLSLLASQPGTDSVAAGCSYFRWISSQELSQLESSSRVRGMKGSVLAGLTELRIDELLYTGAMNTMEQFMKQYAEQEGGDLTQVSKVSGQLVRAILREPDQLIPLATLPYHDNFTHHHCLNVSVLTLRAASLLVQDEQQLDRICQAALLHDLGKIDVPYEILYKPGRLTATESEVMMQHPVTGARRLAATPRVDPLAAVVAFGHHIKDNGHGYPKVSTGYKLPPIVRLLEVVDIFEALTAHRPYKRGMTATQAFEVLYSMPNMASFRPYMDILVRAIGFNPVGSRVKTADGEIAVVVGHEGDDPRRPIIRVVQKNGDTVSLSEARSALSHTDEAAVTTTTVFAIDPEEELQS